MTGKIFLTATGTATVYAFWFYGWDLDRFDDSLIFGVFAAIVVTIIRSLVLRGQRIVRYREMIEPHFIAPYDPETGQEAELPADLRRFVTFVHHRRLTRAVDQMKAKLKKAGNPFYTDEDLKDEDRLPVEAVRYQDGKRVNETYSDFGEYLEDRVRDGRRDWHVKMKRENPAWYDQRHHELI